MPLLSEKHLVRFFIHREVARLGHAFAGAQIFFALLALQLGHQTVHGHIALGVVLGLAADDQRRARFIDQDGIDLIDDGVMQFALHAIGRLVHHVVAQVVKTKLVVGAVGDVAGICRLLFFARHLRQIDAHRQSQKVI